MRLLQLIKEIDDQGKTLYAFDLDDTLIKSSSKVIIKTPQGIKKLTPAEYALYQPEPTDDLDFSEFSQIKDPTLIRDNIKIFLDALSKSSSRFKTIILTARTPDITKDIQDLLDFKKLPQVEIHAVGNSDPQAKAEVIQDYINKGYTNISFFDDSKPNVKAINDLKNLESNKEKGVNIRAVHIVHTLEEAGKGLWHNIRAKRARGEKSSHPNSKAFKSAVQAGKDILKKEYVQPASEEDVNSKELEMGIKVEMEHTRNKEEAKVIALQHLAEDPKYYTKLKSLNLEDIHDPVKPGILKKRLGKLSCTKVREERAKLKDKGTHYAKALQRYLNYHCKD